MAQYARNDTRYLKPLADKLKLELGQKGRLAWHQEYCAQLVAECAHPPAIDHDEVWRIKGSSRLGRRELAVLRELWQWRETEAVAANRPPFFILSHEALVGIATESVGGGQFERLLPQRFSDPRRPGLLKAVEHGLAGTPGPPPKILHSERRWRE